MLRYALAPRWVAWHLLCIGALALTIRLGFWQWERSFEEGALNWRNAAYAVQWWLFSLFVVWFWWRMLRDQFRAEQDAEPEPPADEPEVRPRWR